MPKNKLSRYITENRILKRKLRTATERLGQEQRRGVDHALVQEVQARKQSQRQLSENCQYYREQLAAMQDNLYAAELQVDQCTRRVRALQVGWQRQFELAERATERAAELRGRIAKLFKTCRTQRLIIAGIIFTTGATWLGVAIALLGGG